MPELAWPHVRWPVSGTLLDRAGGTLPYLRGLRELLFDRLLLVLPAGLVGILSMLWNVSLVTGLRLRRLLLPRRIPVLPAWLILLLFLLLGVHG